MVANAVSRVLTLAARFDSDAHGSQELAGAEGSNAGLRAVAPMRNGSSSDVGVERWQESASSSRDKKNATLCRIFDIYA